MIVVRFDTAMDPAIGECVVRISETPLVLWTGKSTRRV